MNVATQKYLSAEALSTEGAPKLTLPVRYLITGILFLNAGLSFLSLNPDALTGHYIRSPHVLAITHLFALGFVTTIIMGAMHQLLPVVLETTLLSETMGKLYFYLYTGGVIGMTWSFISEFQHLGLFTGIVSFSLILFSANAVGTIIKSKKMNYIVWHILAGIISLLITAILGASMGLNLKSGFISDPLSIIRTHFVFSVIGWITITTMGFSYQLIPMFMLSHNFKNYYAMASFFLITSGTLGWGVSSIIPSGKLSETVFASLIFAGVILYLFQMWLIFKVRLRKRIDTPIMSAITAKVSLGGASILGVFIFIYDLPFYSHYALFLLLVLGWAGLYILGMMHKIVPFLVWYNKYSSKIGIEKVPMTKDMVDESLLVAIRYLWIAGLVALAIGAMLMNRMVVQFSGLAMLFGGLLFLWNIVNVFRK